MRLVALSLTVLSLTACGEAGTTSGTSSETTPTSPTSPTSPTTPTSPTSPTTTPVDAVTWYKDIQPILSNHCARCHNEDGIGRADFTKYDEAAPLAPLMVTRIDAGEMPPPSADPACNDYDGSDRMILPPAERDLIAAWADQGAPLGDEATAATFTPWTAPQLSRRDVELRVPAPYTPDFVDGNEYRCFLLDELSADMWISGFEAAIDTPLISHHALFFLDTSGGSQKNITDPATQSWACPSVLPEGDWLTLHAWAPGNAPIEFPAGDGLRAHKGDQIILQMHYFYPGPEADGVSDTPGYYLKTEESVTQEVNFLPLGPDNFTIPAGEVHSETLKVPWVAPMSVLGVMPHMHLLGSGYDFNVKRKDGSNACIAQADGYDFSNQPTYWFKQPVDVNFLDTLSITCTWDNTAANPDQVNNPPIDVSWGENTQEEMCFALMYVTF